jgi:sugar phosphate isomerase/epimerase
MTPAPAHNETSFKSLFWAGGLARDYTSLLEIAAAGDFEHMTIKPFMISQLLSSGRTAEDIVAEARANKVTLTAMDGVSSWAPLWYPADSLPHIKARLDFPAKECLDLAEAVGLQSILVAGVFDRGALPSDVLIKSFGDFCDEAAKRQMRVDLEFIPFWGIPDLPTAWEIVRQANRPNGGILVDTWHLQKGSTDFEHDLQLLASIPRGVIQSIQIGDAKLKPQADSLREEIRFRLFPGDGELANDRILKVLATTGGIRWIGPEVFGAAINDLSNIDAGRRSKTSLQSVIAYLDPD